MGLAGATSSGLHLLTVNTREVAGGAMPRRKGGFDESIKNNGEVLVLVVVAVCCVIYSKM